MVGRPPSCPACDSPVEDTWCSSCGLELASAEAEELRDLAGRVAEADAAVALAWSHRDELAAELAQRRWRRVREREVVPVAAPAPPPSGPEWNVESVRDVLLWLGVALLALSALAFTAVAWTHLGPAGRALLLFGLTMAAGVAASSTRRRLPATAGALTGLTVALALVDWQILRLAGVASGVSARTWWAIGTVTIALLSVVFGRVAAPKPARRAATLLAPTSALLALLTVAGAAWSIALGFSILAALLVVADETAGARFADSVIRFVLRAEAASAWIVAVTAATVAAFQPHSFAGTLAPAAGFASLTIAPGRSLRTSGRRGVTWPAVLVLLAALGSALTLPSTAIELFGELTVAALISGIGLAAAPTRAGRWRRALHRVGGSVGGAALVVSGTAAVVALFAPLTWLGTPWTGAMHATARAVFAGPNTSPMPDIGWCAVAMLVIAACCLPLATRARRDAPPELDVAVARSLTVALLLAAASIVPLALGASAAVACGAATAEVCVVAVLSALASTGERAGASCWLVLLPMVPAVGWASITTTASIVALGAFVVATVAAAAIGRVVWLRALHAGLGSAALATLAAISTVAAGASVATAGFVTAVVGGTLVALGSQLRRDALDGIALEVTGFVAVIVGASLAAASAPWLAGSLTVAVPLFLVGGLRADRRAVYGVAAGTAALGATWAWLYVGGVRVVEAYTLPAAVAALAAGAFAARHPSARSWLTLGPALVLALGPTLVLALQRDDDSRAILVGAAAVAAVLVGARRRLQAPIVLGAAALLALGVQKLGPPAARLPRWLMLALAGSVLLWVGTSFERRRADAQRAFRGFERLG